MDKQYVMEGVILIDDIVVLGCLKGYCAMYQMCQMLTIQWDEEKERIGMLLTSTF